MTHILALDHLTVSRATPAEVVELAARQGWGGACLLLRGLSAFPETGGIDLVGDNVARRATAAASRAGGIPIDWAYPFMLTARQGLAAHLPLLDTAAELGARGVGVLVFDRDPARRQAGLAAFCEAAAARGLRVALEFYPASAIGDLAAAIGLMQACGAPRNLGICADLLHWSRSGGSAAALRAQAERIMFAQLCDAPCAPPEDLAWEAMHGRALPGHGGLPTQAFLRALPAGIRLGVEVPRSGFEGSSAQQAAQALAAGLRAMHDAQREMPA